MLEKPPEDDIMKVSWQELQYGFVVKNARKKQQPIIPGQEQQRFQNTWHLTALELNDSEFGWFLPCSNSWACSIKQAKKDIRWSKRWTKAV